MSIWRILSILGVRLFRMNLKGKNCEIIKTLSGLFTTYIITYSLLRGLCSNYMNCVVFRKVSRNSRRKLKRNFEIRAVIFLKIRLDLLFFNVS